MSQNARRSPRRSSRAARWNPPGEWRRRTPMNTWPRLAATQRAYALQRQERQDSGTRRDGSIGSGRARQPNGTMRAHMPTSTHSTAANRCQGRHGRDEWASAHRCGPAGCDDRAADVHQDLVCDASKNGHGPAVLRHGTRMRDLASCGMRVATLESRRALRSCTQAWRAQHAIL